MNKIIILIFFCIENTGQQGLSKAQQKTLKYYKACMNEARIEDLGAQPLQEFINQVNFSLLCLRIA